MQLESQTPASPAGIAKTVLKIGGGLVLLLLLLSCVKTVDAGQVGIVTRFGEIDRAAKSGIVLKLPWPIEKIHKMDTRIQKEEQEAAAATSDLQDVKATLALNYALDTDTALRVYKEIGTEYKDRVVIPAVQESFKAASADFTATQLITERTAVKDKAYDVIKSRLEKYGIRIIDLNIVNFNFSTEFNTAIEAVQVANQNVARARQELEQTKIEAEKKVAQAKADAEAQRLQQQTLTAALLQKQWIEKWDGALPTYMLGSNANLLLNIPKQ